MATTKPAEISLSVKVIYAMPLKNLQLEQKISIIALTLICFTFLAYITFSDVTPHN